jgi:23S rRNA pseudouridine2605 synthase
MTARRVRVNGEVVTELGSKVDPSVDVVTVDGAVVSLAGDNVYLLLHKPLRVMTTMSDPQGRETVASLVPTQLHPGLFPVGRLDYESTGALLFMTDGELGHRLLHPKWKVEKEYRVLVDGTLSDSQLETLRCGVQLDDGLTAPAIVTAEKVGPVAEYSIVIREGRKRQVRRMFSAVGHPVRELHRVRFGTVELGELPTGRWRYLEEAEAEALRESTGMSEKG